MKVQVVMPIGGIGSRFSKAGITIPKPLIDVNGKPMFMRAVDSVRNLGFDIVFIFVIRDDQNRNFKLAEQISSHLPEAQIVILQEETSGASATVLKAQHVINGDLPLVVLDCDIAFESEDFAGKIIEAVDNSYGGVLLSFNSSDPRYSFAKIGKEGFVLETAEKNPISNHALMGAYFFSKARYFIVAAEHLLQSKLSNQIPEHYMSLTFNHLLRVGKKVTMASGKFYCFGTPEELEQYLKTGEPR